MAAQIHGSGLGLAVVRQIMNAIGGRLSVKSEQGQGKCFHLASKNHGRRNQLLIKKHRRR